MANGNTAMMMMMMLMVLAGGGFFLYMYMKKRPEEVPVAPVIPVEEAPTPTTTGYLPGSAGAGIFSETNVYYDVDDEDFDWDIDWDDLPPHRRDWWRRYYPGWRWDSWRREWRRRRRHWWNIPPRTTPTPFPFPRPHPTPTPPPTFPPHIPPHTPPGFPPYPRPPGFPPRPFPTPTPDHWRLWHEHDWHWWGHYDKDRLRSIGFNEEDLLAFERWLNRRRRLESEIADWLEARLEQIRDRTATHERRWKFPWEE